jgi:hypothetical protein
MPHENLRYFLAWQARSGPKEGKLMVDEFRQAPLVFILHLFSFDSEKAKARFTANMASAVIIVLTNQRTARVLSNFSIG